MNEQERDQLRERLAEAVAGERGGELVVTQVDCDIVDVILLELEAAGYELVDWERFERLRKVSYWAERLFNAPSSLGRANAHELLASRVGELQPGDLDPLPTVASSQSPGTAFPDDQAPEESPDSRDDSPDPEG